MDDDRHDTYRSDSDAVAELEALRRIREELWTALRGEDDPELRISLLSRLSENRAAILRIGEELGLENPQSGTVEPTRSAPPIEPAPSQDDLDDRYFSYGAPSPVASGPLASESQFTEPPPRPRGPRTTGPNRTLPVHEPPPSSSPRWAVVLIGGLVALLAVTWLALSGPLGGLFDDGAESNLAAEGDEETAVSDDDQASQIAAVLQSMGLTLQAERRGDTIYLTGNVASQADLDRAVGAAEALAGEAPIDTSEVVIQTAESSPSTTDNAGRAALLQTEIDRIIAVTPLIFDQGKADLSDLHLRILNNVASIIVAYPNLPVTIVGFTDDLGSDDSNRQLSLDRAEGVRSYLVSQGVPEGQLAIDARGEDSATGAAPLANLERRVEFEVVAPVGGEALPANATTLKVAIVAPSARNDLAFTQSMVDAVNLISGERGNIEVDISDGIFVPEEAATAIRDYAAQGYDLVVAHGSQYGADLPAIATEFPDVAFAWGTASDTFGLPNVYAYDAAAEQGGYVQGTMGALLSQSGTIGVVGPIEVGDAQRYINGFETGAKAENQSTSVDIEYIGSFSDIALAGETAQNHVGAGADVMTGSAQMVTGAVSVAQEHNVLWFGTQANQASLAPQLVVSSQVYHWEVILRQIVADIDAGTAAGGTYTLDLANGGLVIEYNDGVALPADVRSRADQVVAEIANGTIVVPT